MDADVEAQRGAAQGADHRLALGLGEHVADDRFDGALEVAYGVGSAGDGVFERDGKGDRQPGTAQNGQ
ncbi:hypothetical protein ABT120_03700 [Nonomuraea angiospora]|uniref:hypothetical protein n=1 Tax=Nonomuraea angiospora TaxID=46172 RepID=UPI003317906E